MVDLSVLQKRERENLYQLLWELIEKVEGEKKVTELDLLRLQRKYALSKEKSQPFYLKSEIFGNFWRRKNKIARNGKN